MFVKKTEGYIRKMLTTMLWKLIAIACVPVIIYVGFNEGIKYAR